MSRRELLKRVAAGAGAAALAPAALARKVFEANHSPASWGGLAATPRYLARHRQGG